MNYRHEFHAGNFADVFKHIVLTRALLRLCIKPAPFRTIETHAGSGIYDLLPPSAWKIRRMAVRNWHPHGSGSPAGRARSH